MKYLTPVAAGLCCVAVAACGSTARLGSSPQAKKDEAKAERLLKSCEPSSLSELYRSKTARAQFGDCVFPARNRAAGADCVVNGMVGHVPTKARAEEVVLACVGKYS